MKKTNLSGLKLACFLGLTALYAPSSGQGLMPPTPEAKPSTVLSVQEQKEQLELERLRLENEKLKFEMEKAKFENAKDSQAGGGNSGEMKKKIVADHLVEMTRKAEEQAKENKDRENILVLDFVNSEIWNKGVRYSLHELYSLAEDRHWKMDRRIESRSNAGDPRYLYKIRNMMLLKYNSQKRGILTLFPPVKEDDFQILTPQGATLASSIGDVRNAFRDLFFSYDGEDHRDRLKVLKYKHQVDWNFSDRLEFGFDRDGKLFNIRYGVLDEH